MTPLAEGVLRARALPEGKERDRALWALVWEHRRVAYKAAHRCKSAFTDREDARQEAILAFHRALGWWNPKAGLGIHTATRWFLLRSERIESRCGLSVGAGSRATAAKARRAEGRRITAGISSSLRLVAADVQVDPVSLPTLLWATSLRHEGVLLDVHGGRLALDGFEPYEDPHARIEACHDLRVVRALVQILDPQEQRVIFLRTRGVSLRNVGRRIAALRRTNPSGKPLSPERVRQIEHSAIGKLRAALRP